jgi:hypothetical protein
MYNIKNKDFGEYLTEQQIVDLVEERGVGIYPFKEVIDEIVRFTQTSMTMNRHFSEEKSTLRLVDGSVHSCTKYGIKVDPQILQKITWIHQLQITIIVTDVENKEIIHNLTGGGSCGLDSRQNIQLYNGVPKLNIGTINIVCYSINKIILPRLIYLNLYHEFNHAYENYKRLTSDHEKGLYTTYENFKYDEIIQQMLRSPDKDIRDFHQIIYRLFIPDEVNALVGSVYGELKGMNSKSQFYKNDYKNLSSYKIYNDIKNNILPSLKKIPDNQWNKLTAYYKIGKIRFINQTEQKLTDFFHRISKAASLYYDDVEGNKIVEYSVDKGVLCFEHYEMNIESFNQEMETIQMLTESLASFKRIGRF